MEDKKHFSGTYVFWFFFFNFTIKWRKEALFWGDEVNG